MWSSSKVNYSVGLTDGAALPTRERAMLRSFVENDDIKVREVFIEPNTACPDPNDFMQGFTAVLAEDAKISADYLHRDLNGQMMLFKVKGMAGAAEDTFIEASDFDGRSSTARDSLNFAVQQAVDTDMSPSLECRATSSPSSLCDGTKWISCLGAEGRVGMYRVEKDDDDTFAYFLFVQTGRTPVSDDLYHWIYEQGVMDVSKLVDSVQFKYARSMNRRNAQRLAAKAAEALGVSIDTEDDSFAYVDSERHELPPKLGKPCARSEYNTIVQGKWNDKPSFFLYDNTCCTAQAEGGMVLMQDPRSSIFFFPAVSKHAGDSPSTRIGVTTNAIGNSFPVTLGPLKSARDASTQRDQLGRAQMSLVNKRIVWEGKPSAYSSKEAETEWFNHRVVDNFVRRLDINNGSVRTIMRRLYNGDINCMVQMKPIVLKISTNDYSRV